MFVEIETREIVLRTYITVVEKPEWALEELKDGFLKPIRESKETSSIISVKQFDTLKEMEK